MVWAREDSGGGDLGGLIGGELVGPGGAFFGGGAGAGVLVFGITGGGFVGGFVPVVPAGGGDVRAEVAVEEGDAGVGALGGGRGRLSG